MYVLDTTIISNLRLVGSGKANLGVACARLHVPDPKSDRDAMIAATAIVHGTTVVTRNLADFKPTGASMLNPWVD